MGVRLVFSVSGRLIDFFVSNFLDFGLGLVVLGKCSRQ